MPAWDDRELSPEQKAANPLPPDPRWAPFGECMAARGFETRAIPTQAFTQADLDRLLISVNAAMPNPEVNKQFAANAKLPGIAGAFVACADEWLSIPIEDFGKHGWEIPKSP